jgi:hypothetical protein
MKPKPKKPDYPGPVVVTGPKRKKRKPLVVWIKVVNLGGGIGSVTQDCVHTTREGSDGCRICESWEGTPTKFVEAK